MTSLIPKRTKAETYETPKRRPWVKDDMLGEPSKEPSEDSDEDVDFVTVAAAEETVDRLTEEQQDAYFGPKKTSAKDLQRERKQQINEIQRRQNVFNSMHDGAGPSTGSSSGLDSERSKQEQESYDISFQRPEEFMVIRVAHIDIKPYSPEAAIQLCGAFELEAKAKQRALMLYEEDKRCTVLVVRKNMWFLLCKNEEHYRDPDYQASKVKRTLERYTAERTANEAEFRNNVEQRKIGKTSLDKPKQLLTHAKHRQSIQKARRSAIKASQKRRKELLQNELATDKALPEKYKRAEDTIDFPRHLEVRRQNCAAVLFLRDTEAHIPEEEELLFCWMGAFEEDETCQAYIKGPCKNRVTEFNIDDVAMYEWLWPVSADKQRASMKEEFRQPELQTVIQAQKREKNRVEDFEEYCKRQGYATPVTEITRQGKVSGIDMHGKAVHKVEPLSEANPLDELEPMEHPVEDEQPSRGGSLIPQKPHSAPSSTSLIPQCVE